MKSTRVINQGEQIFNDYGPLPRSDLLRMYGYVTDNYAQYDVVEISHDLLLEVAGKKNNRKDTSWRKREEQLDELGIIDDGYTISLPATDLEQLEDAIPGQIHMLLRALCDETTKGPKDPVTIKEAALLQSVLIKRLSEYGTSLQADKSALKALLETPSNKALIPTGCGERRYLCALQVRIGEKEILRRMISLCQSHIAAKTEDLGPRSMKRPRDNDKENKPTKIARK